MKRAIYKESVLRILTVILMVSMIFSVYAFKPDTAKAGCGNYYFYSDSDPNWNTAANWWADEFLTEPAGAVPSVDVDCPPNIFVVTGSLPPVVVIEDVPGFSDGIGAIDASATGIIFTSSTEATLADRYNDPINGEITVQETAKIGLINLATGPFVFNNSSSLVGTIFGNATFNDFSFPDTNASINGDMVLNTEHYGSIPTGGVLTIDGSAIWSAGDITGTISGSDSAQITSFVFNNTSQNTGFIPVSVVPTFNNTSLNLGYIVGDAIFNSTSQNSGTVSGNAVFNGSSVNGGAVNSATFNDTSHNAGSVTVDAIFNTTYYDATAPTGDTFTISNGNVWEGEIGGVIYTSDVNPAVFFVFNDTSTQSSSLTADVTFNDTSSNLGTIVGNATFNTASSNQSAVVGTAIFNASSTNASSGTVSATSTFNGTSVNSGTASGNAIFNESSVNSAEVLGNATFNGTSYNIGSITGNATFNTTYYYATPPFEGIFELSGGKVWEGTIGGLIFGSDDMAISNFVFNGTTSNATTISEDILVIFKDESSNDGSILGSGNFRGTSTNNGSVVTAVFIQNSINNGIVSGTATFSGSSTSGNVLGNAIFNDSTVNTGTTTGNATFNQTSHNAHVVLGNATFNTTYYSGSSVPSSGVLTVNFGKSWDGTVSGNILGSDAASITSFIFNGTSTNETSISNATTTFVGDLSENNGTIDGTRIRKYTSDATVTRDFVTNGAWTVIADGAIVDVSGATFNSATTFQTLNSGSFSVISTACASSLVGTGLSYKLSGDVSGTCTIAANDVTLDGQRYSVSGDIIGNGSSGNDGYDFNLVDIIVAGTISSNGASGSTAGNGGTITIASSSVTTVSSNGGNNSNQDGGDGGSITISNSTSTILRADGGNSTGCGYGGSGGSVTVNDSSYSSISVEAGSNGAGSCGSSGSGGNSSVTDTVPPVITLNGSSSITIDEGSTYTELGATAVDAISGSRTVSISGSVNTAVPGIYTKTYSATDAAGNSASKDRTITVVAVTHGCTDPDATNYDSSAVIDDDSCEYDEPTPEPQNSGSGSGNTGTSRIHSVVLPTNVLSPLTFTPLPTLTSGLNFNQGVTDFGNILSGINTPGSLNLSPINFTFVPRVSSFLFAPVPASVTAILNSSPKLNSLLASVRLSHEQDLVLLSRNPILLNNVQLDNKPPGLFFVTSSSTPLNLFVTGTVEHPLAELVRVDPRQIIDISLIPLSKPPVTGTFMQKTVTFFTSQTKEVYAVVSAPAMPGRYVFTSTASPLPLIIEVNEPVQPIVQQKPTLKVRIVNWFSGLFG